MIITRIITLVITIQITMTMTSAVLMPEPITIKRQTSEEQPREAQNPPPPQLLTFPAAPECSRGTATSCSARGRSPWVSALVPPPLPSPYRPLPAPAVPCRSLSLLAVPRRSMAQLRRTDQSEVPC